jgi:FkbM family methyltransferase
MGLHEVMESRWSIENLRGTSLQPRRVIDCGAYVGHWTRTLKTIFPASQVLMIDANPQNAHALAAVAAAFPRDVVYAIELLGAEQRSAVSYFQMATGSSVLPEQSNVARKVIQLPMRTLDAIAEAHGFTDANFIKLDVQGYELEVLRGARRLLANAELVQLEVSFLEYNREAPLAHEVITTMHEYGFVVFDLGAFTRWGPANNLLQADLFFVRQDSELRPKHFEF